MKFKEFVHFKQDLDDDGISPLAMRYRRQHPNDQSENEEIACISGIVRLMPNNNVLRVPLGEEMCRRKNVPIGTKATIMIDTIQDGSSYHFNMYFDKDNNPTGNVHLQDHRGNINNVKNWLQVFFRIDGGELQKTTPIDIVVDRDVLPFVHGKCLNDTLRRLKKYHTKKVADYIEQNGTFWRNDHR